VEALLDFATQNGMFSSLTGKQLADIRRMSMQQTSEMTTEDLKTLRDVAKQLTEEGKAVRKLHLLYFKDARDAAIQATVKDTANIDPKFEAMKFSMATYLDVLSPLRAAELFDGLKTRGPNYQMAQKLSHHETEAQWEGKTRIDGAVQEAIDAGIERIDPAREPVIMANIRQMEGAETAAQKIIDKHSLTDLTLTAQETKLIEIFEKYTNQKVDELAALYEAITNTPFERQHRYILPLKYESDFNLSPSEVILQTPHAATSTDRGMTIARKPGVNKEPRTDIWGVFEQAIHEQEWFLQMQPALDDVRHVVKSKEYLAAGGHMATDYWTKHLDIVARRGWTAKAEHDTVSRGLRFLRGNLTTGILGYRLSSIMTQPFAVAEAMAYVSAEFGPVAAAQMLGDFGRTWIDPTYAKSIMDSSHALQMRQAGEVAISDTLNAAYSGSAKDKFIRSGMALLQWADVKTAAGVQESVRKRLEERGIPNALKEAETIMQRVSSASDVTLRPHVLARGEAARTWFTFQTFAMNSFGILAHDLVTKNIVYGDFTRKAGALLGLAMLVGNQVAQDDARQFVWETIKRRDMPANNLPLYAKMIFGQAQNIPWFGQMFQMFGGHGGTPEAPLSKTINDMIKGFVIEPLSATEKTKWEKTQKAIFRAAQAAAVLGTGAPGTSQGFDVLDGILFGNDSGKQPNYK
jgi:hypothetical protein